MNKKLIFIIIGIAVLVALTGGLVFLAAQKNNQAPAAGTGPQIKKLLDERVISPIASFDNNAIWYFNSEGRLFRVNLDGSGLSEFPLPALSNGNLKRALWPVSGSDFIAVAGSGAAENKSYYNSVAKIYYNLPSNIQSFDWLPDARRVVYIWKSGDNLTQQLVVADADGSGFVPVQDVFWPDLKVKASPDGKTVLLYRTIPEGDTNKIYLADLGTGVISAVIENGKNIAATWISANRFVFSQSASGPYPKLLSYDLVSRQLMDLGLSAPLDKITVDKEGKYLYAAVPKKDNSGDVFVKLDLASLKQETYFEPSQAIRASGLLLIGNSLYFINSADGKLYELVK